MKKIYSCFSRYQKLLICHIVLLTILVPGYSYKTASSDAKPFRVLLVIGDQWEDPASFVVDMPIAPGEKLNYDDKENHMHTWDFHNIVLLLKSWAIPFDIVRLDQQILNRYMFLDMEGNPKYGTIIWDVNTSDKVINNDYSIINEMIIQYGMSMIAIADRIKQSEIQRLLGIQYIGSWRSHDEIMVSEAHFLTEGIESLMKTDYEWGQYLLRPQVEIQKGVKELVKKGNYTQVTAKEYENGARVVWLGGDPNYMFTYQGMRTLLRNAITWTIGYNLYKTWDNTVILIMDDPGNAQNAWLEQWHYPSLSEEIITKYLINPLQENNAVLNISFLPAFENDEKREFVPSWSENFTDAFGIKQNYISSKEGYDQGVKLGVFMVVSHGLTHMQPDLKSEPGWYGSELDKERGEVGWYREFGDSRRGKEIPAAEQLWRMKTSIDWLEKQFGETPLAFVAGGDETSLSYFNNTSKIAAKAGFGWIGWEAWETGYLGRDMVITNWKFYGTPDSPLLQPILPDGHDYGVSREPERFAEIFEQMPNSRFIGFNEYIGYLHASNSGFLDKKFKKIELRLAYDPHYCSDFRDKESSWKLQFADWLLKEMGDNIIVHVDTKKVSFAGDKLSIPPGIGQHTIEISFSK